MARSHNWSLDEIELFELVSEDGLDPETEQSILEPSEVELGETIQGVMECVDRLQTVARGVRQPVRDAAAGAELRCATAARSWR